jgi:hypothetical protein
MPKTIKDESDFLQSMRDRAGRVESAEEFIRRAANRDLRFLVGDQWLDDDGKDQGKARRANNRPALTFNKLPPFVDQITNEQRKNRPGVKVSPVAGGADQATSEIFQGIIRHIEYASQADVAYDTAFDYAVSSSFGSWRYTTEYADDRSTEQEIKVARIADPASVGLDPDAQEVDCSDAMFCFVFTRMSKDEFKRRYPDSETAGSDFAPIGGFLAPSWLRGDEITIAEYWQVELEKKKLSMYRGIPEPEEDDYQTDAPVPGGTPAGSPAPGPIPGGPPAIAAAPPPPPPPPDADEEGYVVRGFYDDEEVPEGFEPREDDDGDPIGREVEIRHVWRYDTNGHEILGKPKPWAGKYIPIVPCFGKEKIVEGKRFLMSAIRFALDPQQLYNFYKTGEAEVIQQTPKNPYVGVLGQFKTMQLQWADANVVPRTTLEYDPVVVGGTLAPPPTRQQYEPATQALTVGAAAASEDIKATTGLFDPSRGQANPNADSGVAIGLLQQQGATSTYHFFDNFLRSMWHGYRILVDLIPKIYDTPRVIRIVRPNDEAELVQINRMFTGKDGKRLKYDLGLGTYAIALSVQPSFQTQKQQNAAQLAELAKADPAQLPLWSDLYIKQLDLGPLGDEIADRLTPAQYRAQGNNPQQLQQQAAALAQQNQALTAQVHALAQQLETKQYESQQKDAANQRDNQTKALIATMQEETKRNSDAIRLAIAEMQAQAQTGARLTSDMFAIQTEREAMAHEVAMKAHDRTLALHDAANLPPGMPGGPPAPDPNAGAPGGNGAEMNAGAIPPASVDPAAFQQVQNPPPGNG